MAVNTTTLQADGDTATKRLSVTDLDKSEVDTWLTGIRRRRLLAHKRYQEAQRILKETQQERLREFLEKQCNLFDKERIRLDKALSKVEDRLVKVRALRMQLEDGYDGRWENNIDDHDTESVEEDDQ